MMTRQRRYCFCAILTAIGLFGRFSFADAYDPPANYYSSATGTGATLKQQLNDIIDNHTVLSYGAARANLQISDADPAHPGHIITVYDRTSLDVSSFNTSGIPGWDPNVWNREHTWPRSRGIGSSGPDDSDMFELRPALLANNGDRGDLNFGGAFGAQSWGTVNDGGQTYWYPGDADAGMIARQEFYMAVRYDGIDTSTLDLEIGTGNVSNPSGSDDAPPQLGNLTRLIEWNYAAPPDDFERRRNQIIYDQFQHNRNPFTDHPEYVWSVFVDQTNDSQIAIDGATVNADGSSTRAVDLGRVFVNGAVPSPQAFTLNKSGNDGTYFEVTTGGNATSSLSGRFNAMRTNQTDSKSISVGLNTSTTSAGLKSGTVTIDNLDITTGGGAGHGANDANDTFDVSLTVLDHSEPSFAAGSSVTLLSHDFGTIPVGMNSSEFDFDVYNLLATAGFTADMDFDSVTPSGDASAFTTDLAASAGSLVLAGGAGHTFTSSLMAMTVGTFSASYLLSFSDEDIAGALNGSITLTLTGATRLAGDYNGDLVVDAADYAVWRSTDGQSVAVYSGADGDGNGVINSDDYDLWRANFGLSAMAAGSPLNSSMVPEPSCFVLAIGTIVGLVSQRGSRLRAESIGFLAWSP